MKNLVNFLRPVLSPGVLFGVGLFMFLFVSAVHGFAQDTNMSDASDIIDSAQTSIVSVTNIIKATVLFFVIIAIVHWVKKK